MAIIAENKGGGNYTPVEAGSYPARCYSMVHIGTIDQVWEGKPKRMNKLRLTWELPTELKEFKEGEGEKPYIISQDFTLSMHEKSTLRKTLESWRGKGFSEEEAKQFDVTKLIGAECMLSVIHKTVDNKEYANISGISRMPKGMTCPAQINPTFIFSYDQSHNDLVLKIATLPEFLQTKIKSSEEWRKMEHPQTTESNNSTQDLSEVDDLPF